MTPAARIQSVLEILERIEKSPIPMDLTIGDYMRNRRFIGSKDRSAIVEKTYDVIRHHARIGWALEQAGVPDAPSARLRLLALMVMAEGLEKTAPLWDGSRHGPSPITEDEREILDRLPTDFGSAPVEVVCECPPIYAPSLRAYFGDDFADEMAAMIPPAQLNLRVNLAIGDVDKAISLLAEDNVSTARNHYSPWGLKVQGKAFLSLTRAFKKGLIEIQDEGSQLIALCCGARPGQQVLDYCAGAGGKTLALANGMLVEERVKGRIVAMDLEPARLAKAKDRCRRARISDIVELRPLSEEKNRKWLRRQKESFDCVLADVPCSGTGTWRRNPDMRWRVYGPSLEEITEIQADILEKVAGAVKPGGRLVYATCSLLPEENEHQIERFLNDHPEFKLKSLADIWPENLEVPCDGSYLRLTPRRHNSDGFFAAIMERRSMTIE